MGAARSLYAKAYEFGPRDFAIRIFNPLNFSPIQTYGAGWTHNGLCYKLLVNFV